MLFLELVAMTLKGSKMTVWYFSFVVVRWLFVGLSLDGKLCGLVMPDFENKFEPELEKVPLVKHLKRHLGQIELKKGDENNSLLDKCQNQLKEYLEGKRHSFSLPIVMIGTSFQKSVWTALLRIPYGQTLSYKELAQSLSKPKAFRAVAQACRANPLPIFIPCHRVIGKQGLTGYSSGLKWKQYLLDLEGAY